MNYGIRQDNQNDNRLSAFIKRVFNRFHLFSALNDMNLFKPKGISAAGIYQFLFLLTFSNKSMYRTFSPDEIP